jgi:hypothetical protein
MLKTTPATEMMNITAAAAASAEAQSISTASTGQRHSADPAPWQQTTAHSPLAKQVTVTAHTVALLLFLACTIAAGRAYSDFDTLQANDC